MNKSSSSSYAFEIAKRELEYYRLEEQQLSDALDNESLEKEQDEFRYFTITLVLAFIYILLLVKIFCMHILKSVNKSFWIAFYRRKYRLKFLKFYQNLTRENDDKFSDLNDVTEEEDHGSNREEVESDYVQFSVTGDGDGESNNNFNMTEIRLDSFFEQEFRRSSTIFIYLRSSDRLAILYGEFCARLKYEKVSEEQLPDCAMFLEILRRKKYDLQKNH